MSFVEESEDFDSEDEGREAEKLKSELKLASMLAAEPGEEGDEELDEELNEVEEEDNLFTDAPKLFQDIMKEFDNPFDTPEELESELEKMTVARIDEIAAQIDKLTGFTKSSDNKNFAFGSGKKSKEETIKNFVETFGNLAHLYGIPGFIGPKPAGLAKAEVTDRLLPTLIPEKAAEIKTEYKIDLSDPEKSQKSVQAFYETVIEKETNQTKKHEKLKELAKKIKSAFGDKGKLELMTSKKISASDRPELLKEEIIRYISEHAPSLKL